METLASRKLQYSKSGLTDDQLMQLYSELLLPRMVEEKMLILLRQGQISKWFSGIGQEAIAVAAALALQKDEIIFTLHRNLGVFTAREVPLDRLFCQWQGKMHGFSKGRERSFHFGTLEHHIVGMISHLGPQLSLADGVALAHKLKGESKLSLAFTGEGGTSQGEFHEALNTAAVWSLPVIFLIENNGYGLSTPTSEQYVCEHLADRAKGYGMESVILDGNNIIEMFTELNRIAQEIRQNPHPVLVECKTFRMRGHEEASGVKYVPKELLEEWALKDPLSNFELFLIEEGLLNAKKIEKLRSGFKSRIDEAWKFTAEQPTIDSSESKELEDVYIPFIQTPTLPSSIKKEQRFVDALSDGMRESMRKHEQLILMGQDIGHYGGVFKITEGFVEEFGVSRVRNTPLCESAILGAALGLSLKGFKSMVEMQFADFVTCGFNQIVNNLAKLHYRWGAPADVVVRMPTGGGVGAGPFHSQSNEAWFTHTPGLKVLYPSNPIDAKGLLISAFEDPNPIMYFEHKALYRAVTADVPQGYYTTPIGKAVINRPGSEMSIITYGMGVHWANAAVKATGIDAEILDLRTLLPLDYEAIRSTVMNTNKVLVLHEDTMTGGFGGEISAWISEHCFEDLDAPVMRCAGLDSPIPFAIELEKIFMAEHRLKEVLLRLQAY